MVEIRSPDRGRTEGAGGADPGDRNRVDIKAGKFEVSWNGAARVGMIVAGILLIILAFMHDHVGT